MSSNACISWGADEPSLLLFGQSTLVVERQDRRKAKVNNNKFSMAISHDVLGL